MEPQSPICGRDLGKKKDFRKDFRTTENPPPRSPGTETPAGDFDMGALDYNGGMFPHIKTKPRAALAAQW